MRTLFLRRTLQALLVLILVLLVLDWIRNPRHDAVVYAGWAAFHTVLFFLLGPWWIERKREPDPLLAKPRNPWMAFVIYGLLLLTFIPVVTIWAVLWAGMAAYASLSLIADGRVGFGLLSAAIPLAGVVSLYTLWALARFYVREPGRNPPAAQTARYLAGLVLGVGVFVALWTIGDIWRWGELAYAHVLVASLLPLIPLAFFALLMLWNGLRPRLARAK